MLLDPSAQGLFAIAVTYSLRGSSRLRLRGQMEETIPETVRVELAKRGHEFIF